MKRAIGHVKKNVGTDHPELFTCRVVSARGERGHRKERERERERENGAKRRQLISIILPSVLFQLESVKWL